MPKSLTEHFFRPVRRGEFKDTEYLGFARKIKLARYSNKKTPLWHNATQKIIRSRFANNPTVNIAYAKCLFDLGEKEIALKYLKTALDNAYIDSKPEFIMTEAINCLENNGYNVAANQLTAIAAKQYPYDGVLKRKLHKLNAG